MEMGGTRRERKRLRFRDYDYSQCGAYFITLCIQDRLCLLGDVVDGVMHLSQAGIEADRWWHEVSTKFPSAEIERYAFMPNHLHAVVVLEVGSSQRPSLSQVIQWFKTMSTSAYFRGVKKHGWPGVRGTLWQRSFYERVIRNQADLEQVAEYISNNPAKWTEDVENPAAVGLVRRAE
jgi:putative transposase